MFQPTFTEEAPKGEAPANGERQISESPSRPYPLHEAGTPPPKGMVRAVPVRPVHAFRRENSFTGKNPAITGEATFRGTLRVDGTISGQLSANGGAFTLKQRARAVDADNEPELDGEVRFAGMLRVNGHVAGKLLSEKGTLIVDVEALVDADIDVAVAIIDGTVNGDVVARERLELGLKAKINGNIWTRSLKIKPGAIFEGECKILRDQEQTGTA
jgi:cytoskeletal protein CcmA (bactofilin family)